MTIRMSCGGEQLRHAGALLDMFPELPRPLKTPDLCIHAVDYDVENLAHVPVEHFSAAFVSRLADIVPFVTGAQRNRLLETVPEFDQFVSEAFVHNGNALCFFDPRAITLEMCRHALATTPIAIMHVPDAFMDQVDVERALRQKGILFMGLRERFQTYSNATLACATCKFGVAMLPGKYRCYELALEAVRVTPASVNYLQTWEMTDEIIALARGHYVPPHQRRKHHMFHDFKNLYDRHSASATSDAHFRRRASECRVDLGAQRSLLPTAAILGGAELAVDVALAMVETNGLYMFFVPYSQRLDPRFDPVIRCAVEKNPLALMYVPPVKRTPELCELAVSLDGMVLSYLAPNEVTERIATAAVRQNGMALEFVPVRMRHANIVSVALHQCPGAFAHVPRVAVCA